MPDAGDAARALSDALEPPSAAGTRRARMDRRGATTVRIAAVGDFHCGGDDVGAYREMFAKANDVADALVLPGDLTRRGLIAEFKIVVGELADVKIPIVAVLGNHDYESAHESDGTKILRDRGVHVLCGDAYQIDDRVGFAGVKGFIGGFGRGLLTSFGEPETKAIVKTALEEVHNLELALRKVMNPVRIAVMHYSPVEATLKGEPEVIYPYLGTDRLAEPLDRFGATVCFHGHAHSGSFEGRTPGGVPVFNVAHAVVVRAKKGELFYVHEMVVGASGQGPGAREHLVAIP
ncbi:MAG: metallophosphoesterase [Gemmatimonadaceae bacterium]